ncbi:FHA domain-containing protein [Gilvimarinus chinensis]|uniref:FHA domain-containing protein n=1 Tax=Gilvimarinus chinensis TaxID=396005 RepID=UPI00036F57E4|nr:FHA domain-containing protein [Gilvimarinus chinensis]
MAYLYRTDLPLRIPVVAHHTIGALEGKVDTFIHNPYISRRHLCIEWSGDVWQIKDLSRNGTWINGSKLEKGVYYPLKLGDRIQLAGEEGVSLEVQDLTPPRDVLLPIASQDNNSAVIELQAANLIPDEETPEWYLYQEPNSGQWLAQSVADNSAPPLPLRHNDILEGTTGRWQLFCASACAPTMERPSQACISDADIRFEVSLDEESTGLLIVSEGERYNLGIRVHNYLLLQLARHRADDARNGLSEDDQGWVSNDLLVHELGLEPNHLNIQVYRARQQLTKAIPHLNHDKFVERRGTSMRLGCSRFSIHKGGKVEQQLP